MSSDAATSAERAPGYEFTTDQNAVIDGVGTKMRLVGLIVLIFGLLNLLNAVLVQVLFAQLDSARMPDDVRDQLAAIGRNERWVITGYLAIVGLVFLCVGLWTRSAGGSFLQITATRGRDIGHLMDGFNTLNKMYSLIATTLVAAILAYLVLVVVKAAQA